MHAQGEQPHCGFPEVQYLRHAERLVRQGLRVVVVEQTETPEMLRARNDARPAGQAKARMMHLLWDVAEGWRGFCRPCCAYGLAGMGICPWAERSDLSHSPGQGARASPVLCCHPVLPGSRVRS